MVFEVEIELTDEQAAPTADDIHDWVLNGMKLTVGEPTLIVVNRKDQTDLDYLRTRAVALVEEYVEDAKDEGRLDDKVEVSWDYED